MSIIVVVAKYKEDINWVNELNYPYIVYDKSKDYPNVGRESETYLRYIIDNYNNLPDRIVFLQGHPFDHLKIPSIAFVNKEIELNKDTKETILLRGDYLEGHNKYTRTFESYSKLFDNKVPEFFVFSTGAQYIVHKESILHRPLEYYKTIVSVIRDKNNSTSSMANCLVCPWTIERMWPYLFNKNIPHKNISYNDLL